MEDEAKGNSQPEEGSPALPWVQFACVVAIVVVFWLDTQSDVSPPRELYWLLSGIASGLIPKKIVDKYLP